MTVPLPVPPVPQRPGPEKTPHYQGGQWSEGTTWLRDAMDATGESDWDKALRALGYHESIRAGTEYNFRVTLYDRQDSGSAMAPYLVEVSDGNRWHEVSAATLWDALDLMNRWAPLVTASVLSEITTELLLNPDRHGSWLVDILAGARANEPYIDRRACEMREAYARQDEERRQKRAARRAAQGAA